MGRGFCYASVGVVQPTFYGELVLILGARHAIAGGARLALLDDLAIFNHAVDHLEGHIASDPKGLFGPLTRKDSSVCLAVLNENGSRARCEFSIGRSSSQLKPVALGHCRLKRLLLLLGHASIWGEAHFGKGLFMLKTYGRKRPRDFGWEHTVIVELLVVLVFPPQVRPSLCLSERCGLRVVLILGSERQNQLPVDLTVGVSSSSSYSSYMRLSPAPMASTISKR